MRGLAVAFVVLCAVADTVAAQPGNAPVGPPPPAYGPLPPPPPATGPLPGERSPGTALALSLGGTIGAYVLATGSGLAESEGLAATGALGAFLAPSFGHWYAGDPWTDGLTLRLAGAGGVMVGALLLLGECGFEGGDCDETPGAVLLYGGAAAYVFGTILDIATAPGAAHKHNARLRERAARGWAVAPTFTRDRAGLAIGGRF